MMRYQYKLMDTRPATSEQPTTTPAEAQRGRWWFVHMSIIAAFVLFFLFVALLYWNWLRVKEPGAVITVNGNESWAGMVVQVEGFNLNQPFRLELTAENKYSGRIYVTPGVYTVTLLKDGEVRYQRQVNALPDSGWHLGADAAVRPE